jgi:hypothetical protein
VEPEPSREVGQPAAAATAGDRHGAVGLLLAGRGGLCY